MNTECIVLLGSIMRDYDMHSGCLHWEALGFADKNIMSGVSLHAQGGCYVIDS